MEASAKRMSASRRVGAARPPLRPIAGRSRCPLCDARRGRASGRRRETCASSTSPSAERRDPQQQKASTSRQLDAIEAVQSLGTIGERLLTLPRTTVANLQDRVDSLKVWQGELQKGVLPGSAGAEGVESGEVGEGRAVSWPEEPFRGQLLQTLADLEMASLTRRYPKLTNTLLANVMDVVEAFEASYVDAEQDEEEDEDEEEDPRGRDPPPPPEEAPSSEASPSEESDDAAEELLVLDPNADLAEDLLSDFRKEWEPIAEALDASEQFFDDLGEVVKDQFSHDIDTLGTTNSVWKHVGWKEVKELSRKLERLPQLRKLVRDLGRGSRGRGPKRLANAEEYRSGNPEGLITSNLVIEETAGIFRSGEIMSMLPSEASLLAAGRRSPILKKLWHSKRAERGLLSYERVGWMDEEQSNVLDRLEIRPSGLQGPLILCLDTSASMSGVREKVAKALVLECVRGAKRQQRQCYLIAFSGREEVRELELSSDSGHMEPLLEFLAGSFEGGTDLNEPIKRSIELLKGEGERSEWRNADVLIVTDSEVPPLERDLKKEIEDLCVEEGVEVHGLIVGPRRTPNFKEIVGTNLHVFDDWRVFNENDDY